VDLAVAFVIHNIYFDFAMSVSKIKKRKLEEEKQVLQEK
jgi:hypothetical protein